MTWIGAEGVTWRRFAAGLTGKGSGIVAETPLWPYYLALAHSNFEVLMRWNRA